MSNKTAIDMMGAGRELDALIAEKIMGWIRYRREEESGYWRIVFHDTERDVWYVHDANYEVRMWALPPFSTDISAAWRVVEKMKALGWEFFIGVRIENEGWVQFIERLDEPRPGPYEGSWTHHGRVSRIYEDDVPLAICHAALKAVRGG